jgi:Zn-finger nucleic acid-binding protein
LGFEVGQLRWELSHERGHLPSFKPEFIDANSRTPVLCARCRIPGRLISVEGAILIDRCERCGFIWLDHGELAGVSQFVSRISRGSPLPGDVEELLGNPDQLRQRFSFGAKISSNPTRAAIIDIVIGLLSSLF